MLYFYLNAKNEAFAATSDPYTQISPKGAVKHTYRGEFNSMKDAEKIADDLNKHAGFRKFLATDSGDHCWPRYDVVYLPQVGEEVSYTFNGDYYPDGTIVAISKSLKVITTSSGKKYYRRRQTGAWVRNRTWSLIPGHIKELNPSF